MGLSIGIDLGTTNSVVCYKTNQFHFVNDETGGKLVPSVVCYAPDAVYVGREAVENEENYPQNTVRSSKRFIGGTDVLPNSEGRKAQDVATDIMKYLKQITEAQTSESIDGLVVTVPAYFNQNQRLETKLAAESAGFHVLRIINEPTAAALAYGEDSKLNELVLVYDFGGGTFDVTLLQLTEDNVYQVLSTSGDTKLGGDDFDQLIANKFLKDLPANFKAFKDFDVRLKKFAEEVKVQLNYKTKIKRTLKYCGTIDNKIYHHEFAISSAEYNDLIYHLLLKTKSHVLNALNDGSKKISQLDKIILVGGSTKSKYVRDFVRKEFNTRIFHDIDPDLTVAAGAANLAHSISQKTDNSALLIDVTPLSLGIETKGGLLNKVIPRNTSIPVASSQEYITAEDNQDSVNIRIYQGERPLAKDNALLGEFVLSGFEKRPKGQTKIVVKFDIDASGLIHVSAFDKISGLQSQVTLNPLSSDDVNNILNDLEIKDNDEQKILQQIELEDLQQQARTLILSKTIIDQNNEYQETYESLKDNINGLKVFINSLKDE